MTIVPGVNKRVQSVNFCSRRIEIRKSESFPEKILNSIKNNKALDEFVKKGQPKTFWEKIADFFKAEEYVNIYYDKCRTQPYYFPEELTIDFGVRSEKKAWRSIRGIRIRADKKPEDSSKKQETQEERILKKFESITDFDKSLTPSFDIIEV